MAAGRFSEWVQFVKDVLPLPRQSEKCEQSYFTDSRAQAPHTPSLWNGAVPLPHPWTQCLWDSAPDLWVSGSMGVCFVPVCPLCLWFGRYLGLFMARLFTLLKVYGPNHEPGPGPILGDF